MTHQFWKQWHRIKVDQHSTRPFWSKRTRRHFEGEIADRLRLLSVQHTLSQCAVGIKRNRMPSRTGDATGVPIHLMVRVRDSPLTQDAACWHPPTELWPITLDGRPLLIHALDEAEKL